MAGPSITVKFLADTAQLRSQLQQVEGEGSRFASGWRGVAAGVAAGLGTAALINFSRTAVTAAQESEQAADRLRAVFAAQGETTNDAADAALAYASALSTKIGVDDEAIAAAQAQLATFAAVSDETARTAGVFDRATAAAADLAAAGFGTLDSNATQLGKALQDPTTGLTALARAGVTFTDEQREQIRVLQESGDLLGAQNLVLQAVEGQVQGTAEATATSSDKMGVAFGEVSEAVGGALLPAFEALAPILVTVAGFIQDNIRWLGPLAAAFGVWAAAVSVATTVQTAFGVSLGLSVGWIALIVVGIAALIAAVIWAWNNVDWFRNAVLAVWEAIKIAVEVAGNIIGAVISWIADKFGWVATVIGVYITVIKTYIQIWWTILQTAADVIGTIIGWIADRWHYVAAAIGIAVNIIKGYINLWIAAFNLIKDAATAVWSWVTDKFNAIVSVIAGVVNSIRGHVSSIVNAIKAPLNAVIGAWNNLAFTMPQISIPDWVPVVGGQSWGGFRVDFPNIPLLHGGGIVPGRAGSDVLAILQAGEMVIPRAAAAGPAVHIDTVVVAEPVDLDLFTARLTAAVAAGRF